MLQKLTECGKFGRSFIFLQQSMLLLGIREDFGGNPRDADHRDLKLGPDGARMTITPELRLQKYMPTTTSRITRLRLG